MRKAINYLIKVGMPLLLAFVILWWMYRGFQWEQVWQALQSDMSWTWMLLSFPFGILAQIFRAMRWRQVLAPMGEKPRLHTCINAVFLSYASSLAIPRVGEVLRCGILTRYEGTKFSRSVGTVVTERVVDTTLILLLTFFTILIQIPVFLTFFHRTGVSLDGFLHGFSLAGYAVTAICGVVAIVSGVILSRRLGFFSRTKAVITDLRDGLFSVRDVEHPMLFVFYSLGIWVCYYLHFYLTFFCFDFSENLGPVAALVAFVVGSFAVIVPTPNGAGPWHFAVKTILVLYGVSQVDAALFVLIVHTLQTLLVVALGLYALTSLLFTARREGLADTETSEK